MTSTGVCRGGNSPENEAGKQLFGDKDCTKRCNGNLECTGFAVPKSGDSWCDTYTSIGATGDGRSQFTCYMKQGNVITQA